MKEAMWKADESGEFRFSWNSAWKSDPAVGVISVE
jgi:hypothetical protein